VPTLARWPGKIAPGSESDQVWAFWDLMPTAAEIAGVVAPFLDVIETSTVLRPVDVDGAEHHAIDNRVVAVRDAS